MYYVLIAIVIAAIGLLAHFGPKPGSNEHHQRLRGDHVLLTGSSLDSSIGCLRGVLRAGERA
jgi:hypothetical protein